MDACCLSLACRFSICRCNVAETGASQLHCPTLEHINSPHRLPALPPFFPSRRFSCTAAPALGSTVILGNSLAAYRDRLVSPDVAQDPSNAIAHAENLIQESPVHPYPIADRLRWRRDADALPHLERAFNDLSFSYSGPELRESEAGRIALLNRPTEFVEDSDGELVTGKAVNGGLCRSSFDLQL